MEVARFDIPVDSRLVGRVDGIWGDYDEFKPDGSTYDEGPYTRLAEGPDGRIYRTVDLVTGTDDDHFEVRIYDGESWERVPGTLYGIPWSIAVAVNGDIYVGGVITEAGGVSVVNIAFYDVSAETWVAMEDGLDNNVVGDGRVSALVFHPSGDLYIGGFFNTDGNAMTENYKGIVRWDGSSFHAIGGGPSGVTNDDDSQSGALALGVSADGSLVYLGGNFDSNGDKSVALNNIARYVVATDTIEALGSSASPGLNNTVSSLVVAPDNSVYIAGTFTALAVGDTMTRITRWTGSAFQIVGTNDEFASTPQFIAVNRNSGLVFIDGTYFGAVDGSNPTGVGVAVWNGSVWTSMDLNITSPLPVPTSMLVTKIGDIFVGFYDPISDPTYEASAINTVVNAGSAPAPLVLTIEGGEGRLTWLENLTSDQRIYLDYSITVGETLVIDTGAGTVVSNLFGNVLRAILKNSDFGSFEFLPGENTLLLLVEDSFEVSAVGSLVPRHWSVDALGA